MNSSFAHCLRCLSPNYLVDCPKTCETLFQKILGKLVPYKYMPAKEADLAKLQHSAFLYSTIKVNENDFVKFSEVRGRIDTFLFQCNGENNRYINMF